MRGPVFILFLFFTCVLIGQKKGYFQWPLDSPLTLTGNYGEIRPNHFHAGIDFSTNGKTDLLVYAAAEGYVSRIRASAVGYGKSLYITHPNGKVTVYAHLNSYSLKVDKIAKAQQYSQQKFEIDYYPPPHTIHVKKGEIVALSGNSGGSTGPHLHFEIRDEKTETPLNPLEYYSFRDPVPPSLTHLRLYDLSDTTAPAVLLNCRLKNTGRDSVALLQEKLLVHSSKVALAFAGSDRYRAGGNANNIYSAKIFLDGKLVYHHVLDKIAFTESKYVNEYCDVERSVKYQKCFLTTLYPQEMYEKVVSKGILELSDSVYHKILLVLSDESGNKTSVQLQLKPDKNSPYKKPDVGPGVFIDCAKEIKLQSGKADLLIPPGTFYRSTYLQLTDELEAEGRVRLKGKPVNFNSPVTLGFKIPAKFKPYKDKILLRSSAGNAVPIQRNDSLFFGIKAVDVYQLVIDTIVPKLRTSLAPSQIKDAWKMNSFSFVITDNLSGIGKYDLYLNNVWVLAELDAKSNTLTYFFDDETPIGLLQFRLEVEDRVGNRETLFYLLKK